MVDGAAACPADGGFCCAVAEVVTGVVGGAVAQPASASAIRAMAASRAWRGGFKLVSCMAYIFACEARLARRCGHPARIGDNVCL
jgi:hypothetical protein